ncbi:MAG TPA: TerC family protein [Fibrobacteria bacterium]|nr:TerC family protein [Fibrobacteria bacterium]
MSWMTEPEAWIAFATLLGLEIVLGVDNIIFIGILAGKLPKEQQAKARYMGLGLALIMRVILLFSISWVVGLTAPLFSVFGLEVSGRDLILFFGGLFLIGKATHEIHQKLEGETGKASARVAANFGSVLIQILLLDMVFSLDSVITAVGMVQDIGIMISAVVVSIAFMMVFAGPMNIFVDRHPTLKVLALNFLILIGLCLVAEGLGHHIPKGYVYFAMGFSIMVEAINIRIRVAQAPVKLHEAYATGEREDIGGRAKVS